MKTSVSEKWVNVAVLIFKIPGVKFIVKPFANYYLKLVDNYRNQCFKNNGMNVLKEFDDIMQQNKIHYTVYAGTLLGAVREKGLLKHDLDIDTMMFNDDYSPRTRELLEKAGFKLIHSFLVDDGKKGREETYEKNDVTIDIFFIYKDETYPTYQCDFLLAKGSYSFQDSMNRFGYVVVRRFEFPVSHGVKRVPFENIEVNIPDNAEEWLACRYGNDYMIPNPLYHDKGDNPSIYLWKDVKGIYQSF